MYRLPHATAERLNFQWDGRPVEARIGDTVAAALYAAGHRTIAHSRKFHRPRGLSGAFVAGHLARVDGVPNVRLDRAPVRAGLDVRPQNVWPRLDIDFLALARLIPRRLLRAGFEHTRLIPSGTPLFEPWEALLRFMAGMAAPPGAATGAVPGRRLDADTVVIGGGPAGIAAARAADGSVVLITRGAGPGTFAARCGAGPLQRPPSCTVLAGQEAFALYRQGRLVAAAPVDGGPAVVIQARRVVLATGRRSCPPLIPGADLPGVLDLHAALTLVCDHAVAPGRRVAVIGAGDETKAAQRLGELGVTLGVVLDAHQVTRIVGRSGVAGIEAEGRRHTCDAVIHAGPWRPDPSLAFQAGADGTQRLEARPLPARVTLASDWSAEPIAFGPCLDDAALVCPCMDVTVAEVRALVCRGESHVEVVKRLTGCGMGTCQGVPCWDLLAATLGAITGQPVDDRPSLRPPRGTLTLAQAAGLADVVEVEP